MTLDFHIKTHNRTVTYTKLARAAGFENFGAENMQYGKFGRALGEELGRNFCYRRIEMSRSTAAPLAQSTVTSPTKSEF